MGGRRFLPTQKRHNGRIDGSSNQMDGSGEIVMDGGSCDGQQQSNGQ
jgi:hypothetical protein